MTDSKHFPHLMTMPAGEVNPHGDINEEIKSLVAKGISMEAATYATVRLFHLFYDIQLSSDKTGAGDFDVAVMLVDGGDGSSTMFIAYTALTEEGKRQLDDMGKPHSGITPDIWFDAPLYENENPIHQIVPQSLITLTSTKPSSVFLFNEIFWDNETACLTCARNSRNNHGECVLDQFVGTSKS